MKPCSLLGMLHNTFKWECLYLRKRQYVPPTHWHKPARIDSVMTPKNSKVKFGLCRDCIHMSEARTWLLHHLLRTQADTLNTECMSCFSVATSTFLNKYSVFLSKKKPDSKMGMLPDLFVFYYEGLACFHSFHITVTRQYIALLTHKHLCSHMLSSNTLFHVASPTDNCFYQSPLRLSIIGISPYHKNNYLLFKIVHSGQ